MHPKSIVSILDRWKMADLRSVDPWFEVQSSQRGGKLNSKNKGWYILVRLKNV